ncbi:MAG: undecaprenyl/decaprenyl-phosphate alpha-N-acetylglucosaminyl 1-phosphate transferase [Actinomycetota bacterium]|nr:undecaprenyl/decaprenyl-phosphate alpha-N-acetylglucosaminyl 1-phosphate transferase [Actinomycetota bacterium]
MSTQFTVGAFIVAYAAAFAITPVTSKLARRLGILDHPQDDPGGHKRHSAAVPYLGGVAIFVGTVAGSIFMGFRPELPLPQPVAQFALGLAIAVVLGLVGLADDIRPLPRSGRFIVQVAAALAAWQVGFRVQATPSDAVNVFITVLWIVGITNAFNLLDNMDGLSAGLAGVGALSFAVMGALGDLPELAVIAAALGGASLGFLGHNRHPARVFMGDAGSLFLGFLLAIIGIELRFENLVRVTFLIPVIVLGLPILDTTLVTLSRARHGRKLFLGHRDHVSHRLVQVGLPVKTTVRLLYWTGLCLGWLGLVISRATPQVAYMLLGFVVALGVFFGWLLFRVPVYEEDRAALEELEQTQEEDKVTYLESSK